MEQRKYRQVGIFKPNARCTGGALRFSLVKFEGDTAPTLLLEMAKQSGEKAFDWVNKITISLTPFEIGSIILGMNGQEVKLFHDLKTIGKTGTKTLSISAGKIEGSTYFSASYSNEEDRSAAGCPVLPNEAVVLGEILRYCLPLVTGFADLKEEA